MLYILIGGHYGSAVASLGSKSLKGFSFLRLLLKTFRSEKSHMIDRSPYAFLYTICIKVMLTLRLQNNE